MTGFWLLAGAMTLAALLFIVPPLLRSRQRADIDRNRLNTAVIKEQLAELRTDLEAGRLDQAAYAAARRDLERELLDDLDSDRDGGGRRGGRWAAAVLVLAVPALAVLLYQQLGAVDLLTRQAASRTGPPLEAMVARLAEHLRSDPDNLQGWVLLGRSYATLGRFDDAVWAYAQARRLAGDQPGLLTDYADLLLMANGGEQTDEVGALLRKALRQQADNVKALWLMGHWHYQRGQPQKALDYWRQAASHLPAGSEDAAAIRQQIQQLAAQQQIDTGSAGTRAEHEAQPATAASVRVSVRLDPALRAQVSPDDTLFIFARAQQGPRMPLAIVRKRAADLPLSVTLDDSLAMNPAMVLSRFKQVTVSARISKSGQALPASGDLQGQSAPVSTDQSATVNLVIDQVVP